MLFRLQWLAALLFLLLPSLTAAGIFPETIDNLGVPKGIYGGNVYNKYQVAGTHLGDFDFSFEVTNPLPNNFGRIILALCRESGCQHLVDHTDYPEFGSSGLDRSLHPYAYISSSTNQGNGKIFRVWRVDGVIRAKVGGKHMNSNIDSYEPAIIEIRTSRSNSDRDFTAEILSLSEYSAAAYTCDDGLQNQNETGVDCGGVCGGACSTCDDNIQNQDEAGVDCGGTCPQVCTAPGPPAWGGSGLEVNHIYMKIEEF